MVRFVLVLTALAFLTGCTTTLRDFLGSSDPCGQAENIHAAFLTFAAHTPKITDKQIRAERTAIAAVREYCASGDVKKVTLQRVVATYAAAVTEYRRNN